MNLLGTIVFAAVLTACAAGPLLSREPRAHGYGPPDWCCPQLLGAHSLFRPIGQCRVQAAAITHFGNCSNHIHQGYWWFVEWGDGYVSTSCTTDLGPFDPEDHKYSPYFCGHTKQEVCINVWYCNSPDSRSNYCSYNAACCDYFRKCFTVY